MRRRVDRRCAIPRWLPSSAGLRPPRKRSKPESRSHRTRRGTAWKSHFAPASPRPCSARKPPSRRSKAWRANGGATFAAPAFSSKICPLRRFFEVLEQHHDLEEVRALLGQARIDTTQVSTTIKPSQLKRAVS